MQRLVVLNVLLPSIGTYLDVEPMVIELVIQINESQEVAHGRKHALANVVSAHVRSSCIFFGE